MDHNSLVVSTLYSKLPVVVEKLETVLSTIRKGDPTEVLTQHLENDRAIQFMLTGLSNYFQQRRGSVDFHRIRNLEMKGSSSRKLNLEMVHPASDHQEETASRGKASHESKKPSRLPPILSKVKKSKSYSGGISKQQAEEGKARKHKHSGTEPLFTSISTTLLKDDASSELEAFNSAEKEEVDTQSQLKPFVAGCGDDQVEERTCSGSVENSVDAPEKTVWDVISQKGDLVMKAMLPVEESSESFSRCLKREKKRLEEELLAELQDKDLSLMQQNQEIAKLRKEHDQAQVEIDRWRELHDSLKAKIAEKEKVCHRLRCEIDKKASETPALSSVQVMELKHWNVKIALRLCDKILVNSKSSREYAMKSIIRIAKSVKGLESELRPWTS